jgi:hypothetical protein
MNATKTFWSLMERWRVPGVEALELIEFWGKTGKSGRRPRFRLNTKQQRTLSYLTEIDAALNAAGEEAGWLHRKVRGKPLSGRSPLAYMIEGGQEAMADVLRVLAGKALRASLATAADASRSAPANVSGVSR